MTGNKDDEPDARHSLAPGRESYDPATDPTRMANQPALQTSGGAIWIVVGAIFAAIAIGALVAIALTSSPATATVSWSAAATVFVLFVVMVLVRLATRPGRRRLRWMAGCFLTMAFVALVGVWLSAVYNAAMLE